MNDTTKKCKVCKHEEEYLNICSKCGHVIELDADVIDRFLNFLQGEYTPKNFTLQDMPKLTPEQAFTVIYVLQEWMLLIPDHYEKCSICHHIYNTESEGSYISEETLEEHEEMDYNFTKEDIGKFFCGGCEK